VVSHVHLAEKILLEVGLINGQCASAVQHIERKRGKKKKNKTRERRERLSMAKWGGENNQSAVLLPFAVPPSLLFLLDPMAAAADAPKGLGAGPTRP
jgi:hypothetical protein